MSKIEERLEAECEALDQCDATMSRAAELLMNET